MTRAVSHRRLQGGTATPGKAVDLLQGAAQILSASIRVRAEQTSINAHFAMSAENRQHRKQDEPDGCCAFGKERSQQARWNRLFSDYLELPISSRVNKILVETKSFGVHHRRDPAGTD